MARSEPFHQEMVSRRTGWRGWEALPISSLWAPAVLLEAGRAWRRGGGDTPSGTGSLSASFYTYSF